MPAEVGDGRRPDGVRLQNVGVVPAHRLQSVQTGLESQKKRSSDMAPFKLKCDSTNKF